MKKIFLFLLFAFSLSVGVVSCDAFDDDNQKMNTQTAYLFKVANSALPTVPVGDSFVELEVAVTTLSTEDRTVSIAIDTEAETSTAVANQYILEAMQVVIPAGSYSGVVKVFGVYANLPADGDVKLVLNLSSDEGIVDNLKTHTVSLFRACDTNTVVVSFNFDGYGSEVSWDLQDAAGNIIGAGAEGDYTDGQASYSEEFCLGAGTYTFNVSDSFGDGLSFPNNGTVTVTSGSTLLFVASGDYGFGTSGTFTLQ
jgi:hypothetical protein